MASRGVRLVENQERFRRANERLSDRIRASEHGARPIPFLCECADDTCTEPVHLTEDEYRAVRADKSHFVIVPGHKTIEGEDVVDEHKDYAVVAKRASRPRPSNAFGGGTRRVG
jgi:hypothetical protein